MGWDDDPQVEAALEEGCGFETKDADLKSADSGCREQSAATKKRAAWLDNFSYFFNFWGCSLLGLIST